MSTKGVVLQGIAEKMALNALKRLAVDSSGRLRVASESTTQSGTWNIGQIGIPTQSGRLQMESYMAYQQGFRRNLVQS